VKLTKREIDTLACPPGRKDLIVFDDALPGFGLRVTKDGAKVFLLQFQPGGRTGPRRRLVLGRYGEITPGQARRLAEAARAAIRLGRDPAAERADARRATAERQKRDAEATEFTFTRLIDEWAAIALKDRSASHRTEAPRALRTCFKRLLGQPADKLTAAELQTVVDAMAVDRPVMARRVRSYARAAFNWGLTRGRVSGNPFDGVVIEARETKRDRALSDPELAEAWRAAGCLPYPFGPFLQLLILTLQRRGEVAAMAWEELSPDLAMWTIPAERTKNRKSHLVPLAEPARQVLRSLPRRLGTPLVFATLPRERPDATPLSWRPISGFSDAMKRLQDEIRAGRLAEALLSDGGVGLPPLDWRLHDFRRTGVTVLAGLGTPPHVADRILNHIEGTIRGVAAVYQRQEFLQQREAALRAWAAFVTNGRAAGLRVWLDHVRQEAGG